MTDGDRAGVGVCEGLDDEVGFAGFVGGGVEVVDFAGGEPGACTGGKEVVHGAGMVEHACGWVGFLDFLRIGGLRWV